MAEVIYQDPVQEIRGTTRTIHSSRTASAQSCRRYLQTQKAQKELRNGQLIIRRGEKIYTPAGIEIQ